MQLQIFKVLILSTIILTSWANASQSFGQTKSGTTLLVESETRITGATGVTFNLNNEYAVTIDKVEFQSSGVTCKKNSGGPFDSGMNFSISPTERSRKQGTSVNVIVRGRWNKGARKQEIPSSAISFE